MKPTMRFTLRFFVNRPPVSTNAMYKRRNMAGGGKGLMLSSEARDFKDAVSASAMSARSICRWWPKWPESVKDVSIEITVYNTKHDVDAPCKLVMDGMEGIVYKNDKCVSSVTAKKEKSADAFPRVEVKVTLLGEE
jgi:Holliday junction resolvase RusA-like endonuclease